MNGSIVFNCNAELAAGAVRDALQRRGLRVMRSFDLQSAQAAAAGCTCPHHGTERCTCEYFVLLVYGTTSIPAVITVHGRDERLHAQMVEAPGQVLDPELAAQVGIGLLEASMASASTDRVYMVANANQAI